MTEGPRRHEDHTDDDGRHRGPGERCEDPAREPRCSHRATGGSAPGVPDNRNMPSAGVTVMATRSDATSATRQAPAKGGKNESPDRPSMRKIGTRARAKTMVAHRTVRPVRVEAPDARRARPSSSGSSRRRRPTSSTLLRASWTTAPSATHEAGEDHDVERRPEQGAARARRRPTTARSPPGRSASGASRRTGGRGRGAPGHAPTITWA